MNAVTLNRLLMRAAYNLLRLAHRFLKLSARGAGVAVWHQDEILVVRHSYRPGWSLPGGRAKRNEEPRMTASREVSEEVGLELIPDDLVLISQSRSGHSLFECELRAPSELRIDNREIVEAKFVDPKHVTDADWLLFSYLRTVIRSAQQEPASAT